jgi:DNA-binding phage protein
MTPQVPLSEPLYAKLKEMAEPFVDTPETVISKAIDFYLAHHHSLQAGAKTATSGQLFTGAMIFQPDAPPDLSFTRPVAIEFAGTKFDKPMLYWNPLLFEIVRVAATKIHNIDQLKQMLLCNYVDGDNGKENGYRFIPEAGLSVQGQAANPAWKTIVHLLKTLGLNLSVTFVWEDKSKAAFPGKTGKMTFAGP